MANVLLLADETKYTADNVALHIGAIRNSARHKVSVYNPRGILGSVALDLDEFDAVIIHYSIVCCSDVYLHRTFREKLKKYQGLKVQFIQDEYRWINDITAAMRFIGVDVLFTMMSPCQQKAVYSAGLPGVKIIETLAGFVPPWPRPALYHPRPIDVGYRGRVVPMWLGALGQEKITIAKRFKEEAKRYGLNCDIAWRETDRIYGQGWIDFLSSCKAVLGTETGSSITDWDRSIENAVKGYLDEHPAAEFDEVAHNVLAPYEGNAPVVAISPRIFEAAALGTALILFPGDYTDYAGIVKPWEHYIPLRKDFGNMDEVVHHLRDYSFIQNLTDRAYIDLVASGRYSYATLTDAVDRVLDCATPERDASLWRYKLAKAERLAMLGPSYTYWATQFLREGRLPDMVKLYAKRWHR